MIGFGCDPWEHQAATRIWLTCCLVGAWQPATSKQQKDESVHACKTMHTVGHTAYSDTAQERDSCSSNPWIGRRYFFHDGIF